MLKKYLSFPHLMIYAVIFVAGFLSGGLIATRLTDFFNVKVTDILSILTTVAVGLIVSYYLARSMNFDARRRELVMDQLKNLNDLLTAVNTAIMEYYASQTTQASGKVVAAHSDLSKQFSLVKDILTKTKFVEDSKLTELENKLLKFKSAVTGGGFLGQTHQYTDAEKQSISDTFAELKLGINQLMVELYQ